MKNKIAALLLMLACTWSAMAADPVYDINQLVKKGKSEQALEQINAYLGAQSKNAWGRNITQMRFLKGVLLAEQKRNPEAIQVFIKLTQDYPDLPEPYNNLAAVFATQGQFEKARDVLERGLRTDPAYAAAYRNLNNVYAQLASRAYDRTVQADKNGQSAPVLIKDLCDNYGRVANQAVGRNQVAGDISLITDIPKSRSSAAAPPSKVDVDEMAMASVDDESPIPPAFNNPSAVAAVHTPSIEPAKVDESKKAAAPLDTAVEKGVLASVDAWAASWSRKDAAAYLGFYAKEFHTPNGVSRADWTKLRRERIAKPKSIKVTVEQPKVVLGDATHAAISFRQGYRSDNLQTTTRKILLMVKVGGKWMIQEERVGS